MFYVAVAMFLIATLHVGRRGKTCSRAYWFKPSICRYELLPTGPWIHRPRQYPWRGSRILEPACTMGPRLQGYVVCHPRDVRRCRCSKLIAPVRMRRGPKRSPQIYRAWIIWDRNWKVIILPVILLIVSISKWLLELSLDVLEPYVSHSIRLHRLRALHRCRNERHGVRPSSGQLDYDILLCGCCSVRYDNRFDGLANLAS